MQHVGQKNYLATMSRQVDVIEKILAACYKELNYSLFIMSLMHQYEERGFLTKKQMIGLRDQAKKIEGIPSGWLATLEANIERLPDRFKSDKPDNKPLFEPDEKTAALMADILLKFPGHKRILFLKGKLSDNSISPAEKNEVEKLHKLLMK